jgi:hypothetical protein
MTISARDTTTSGGRMVWGAAAATVLGILVASAASLNVSSTSVSAAVPSTPRCSTAGTAVVETITSSSITGVTISNLDAACQGGTLDVTVNAGAGNLASGSGTVPSGGTMTVTTSPALAFVDNTEIDVVIVGP